MTPQDKAASALLDFDQVRVVAKSASKEIIDQAEAFAFNVALSNEYRWPDYMRDQYASMVANEPDTGYAPVRRDDLDKIIHPDCYSFNEVSDARSRILRTME
jgi:hypothetical protein